MTDNRFQLISSEALEKHRMELLKKGKYSFISLLVQCLGKCRYLDKTVSYFLVQCLFNLITRRSGAAHISFYMLSPKNFDLGAPVRAA